MVVKLINVNVANYDLKEETTSKIPFNTFVNMCSEKNDKKIDDREMEIVKARLFKSINEFNSLTKEELEEFEVNTNVHILPNGQFIVLKKTNIAHETEAKPSQEVKQTKPKKVAPAPIERNVTANTETY